MIEADYEEARPFREGRAAVRVRTTWGFVGKTGAVVVAPAPGGVESFQNGLAVVYKTVGAATRHGYVDRAGAYVWVPTD